MNMFCYPDIRASDRVKRLKDLRTFHQLEVCHPDARKDLHSRYIGYWAYDPRLTTHDYRSYYKNNA